MWYLFVFDISFAKNWLKQIFSCIRITPYSSDSSRCVFFVLQEHKV